MIYFTLCVLHFMSTKAPVVWAQPQHAFYESYGQINATFCGLSKKSLELGMKTNCFEWHSDHLAHITSSRDVTPGEAPWTVFIKGMLSKCTGVIVDHSWILTANSCLRETEDKDDIRIYPGYEFVGGRRPKTPHVYDVSAIYRHPGYSVSTTDARIGTLNDMALLRLSKGIAYNYSENAFFAINICLPQMNISNDVNEYALLSGWGKSEAQNKHLQIGHRIVAPNQSQGYFFHYSIDNKHIVCEADSGALIWQYYMGRAVLIGIHVNLGAIYKTKKHDEFGCSIPHRNYGYAIRISEHIQWILDVIRVNQ